MVSSGVDFHDDIAHVIGSLRAEDGVYVSMGNHDYFGDGEPLITLLRAKGAIVLRNEGTTVTRGKAQLFVAGVDDTWTRRADLGRALEQREPGAFTLRFFPQPPSRASAWSSRGIRTVGRSRSLFSRSSSVSESSRIGFISACIAMEIRRFTCTQVSAPRVHPFASASRRKSPSSHCAPPDSTSVRDGLDCARE
jgi:hypothetical protein